MSFITFRQQCDECLESWNAAFGIVGTTQIAAPPTKCPKCGSENLSKIADEWLLDKPDGTKQWWHEAAEEARLGR